MIEPESETSETGWMIQCDHPGCPRDARYAGLTKSKAREGAEDIGWQFLAIGFRALDYCPDHRVKLGEVQLRDSCGYPAKGGG